MKLFQNCETFAGFGKVFEAFEATKNNYKKVKTLEYIEDVGELEGLLGDEILVRDVPTDPKQIIILQQKNVFSSGRFKIN